MMRTFLYCDAGPVGLEPFGDEPCGIRVDPTPDLARKIQRMALMARTHELLEVKARAPEGTVFWLADDPMGAETDALNRAEPYTGVIEEITLIVNERIFWFEGRLGKPGILIASSSMDVRDLPDAEHDPETIEMLTTEQGIADWIRGRITDGDLEIGDIPVLMARYAIQDPLQMREEIAERILAARAERDD